jgi:hypothetical protein
MRVTNVIPLGCSLLLPVDVVNSVQTLKVQINEALLKATDAVRRQDTEGSDAEANFKAARIAGQEHAKELQAAKEEREADDRSRKAKALFQDVGIPNAPFQYEEPSSQPHPYPNAGQALNADIKGAAVAQEASTAAAKAKPADARTLQNLTPVQRKGGKGKCVCRRFKCVCSPEQLGLDVEVDLTADAGPIGTMADPPDEYCCPLSSEIMVRGSLVSAFLWLRVCGTVVRSFIKVPLTCPPH